MVSTLLVAYPDAVNIPERCDRELPIHVAAGQASAQVMQMIAEANMSHFSALASLDRSVAHYAVMNQNLDTLRYIHSIKPELLLAKNEDGLAPIAGLVFLKSSSGDPFQDFANSMSVCSDILRFLLHHCRTINPPSAEDDEEEDDDPFGYRDLYQTLTDADDRDLEYPRRLLLLAGTVPSLYLPDVLRELTYSARRGAVFMFFSRAAAAADTSVNIFSRIRHGPAGMELIRIIIKFL